MLKMDEVDVMSFEGCSEEEITQKLGSRPSHMTDDWVCSFKVAVTWYLADGRIMVDFRHTKEEDRCISCRLEYSDETKEVTEIIFEEGMVKSARERYGKVCIKKYPRNQTIY